MITVPNFKILDMLPNKPADKEYALIEDEHKLYQYIEEKWQPVDTKGAGIKFSLYDINKTVFEQLEPMSDEALLNAKAEVFKFLGETMVDEENDYWALICWERRYITIFHHTPGEEEELTDVFMEIIESLGDVKDITNNEDGSIEVWITDEKDTYCYVFFNYKLGVVEGIA